MLTLCAAGAWACTTVNVDPVGEGGTAGTSVDTAGSAGASGRTGGTGGTSSSVGGSSGGGAGGVGSQGGSNTGGNSGSTGSICTTFDGHIDPEVSDLDAGTGSADASADAAAIPAEPLASSNVLLNASFEDGFAPWTAYFGGVLSSSTARSRLGARSARVSNRTDTYQGVFYDVTDLVETGKTYRATAYASIGNVDCDTTANVKFTARVTCVGLSHQYLTIHGTLATSTEWTKLNGDLPMPVCDLGQVLLYIEGPPGGVDLYVDDALLELD